MRPVLMGERSFSKKIQDTIFLFNSSDPIEWARGLQRAGYATDPNYANSLIALMRS
ncbi:glucosaminidase domain-containing protein [Cronobacter sakazakii]